ncbi:hypothetical protein AB3N04_00910 (plasmid) [Alkalihalophilus sp. As8PL]|uniref:Uncharacterized protein n=1 Tax=Alkalihalophilus sp. As8PL TaxID=3237103 RepID=A0AB39BNF7_9BACI
MGEERILRLGKEARKRKMSFHTLMIIMNGGNSRKHDLLGEIKGVPMTEPDEDFYENFNESMYFSYNHWIQPIKESLNGIDSAEITVGVEPDGSMNLDNLSYFGKISIPEHYKRTNKWVEYLQVQLKDLVRFAPYIREIEFRMTRYTINQVFVRMEISAKDALNCSKKPLNQSLYNQWLATILRYHVECSDSEEFQMYDIFPVIDGQLRVGKREQCVRFMW